ncbi:LysR family transcriptional regulator [Novosphingobium panipatense]
MIATRAPLSRSRRAAASPIPLDPPVTRAVFPFSIIQTSFRFSRTWTPPSDFARQTSSIGKKQNLCRDAVMGYHQDMRFLTRLKSLQALEAAARHGSFVGAAAELDVTPPAVGQLVRSLEDWVGYPLFRRTRSGAERLTRWTRRARRWRTSRRASTSSKLDCASCAAARRVR